MKNAARQSWGTELPSAGKVMVTITYFFQGASLDVDNMPKPILDELNGLVFFDDSQVTDLICRKRDLNVDLPMQNPSPLLLETLPDVEQPVQITIANAQNQEFGNMVNVANNTEYLLTLKTAEEYRSKGYEVLRDAALDFLPGYRADLLVKKGDEVKVIEVKTRSSLAADPKIAQWRDS